MASAAGLLRILEVLPDGDDRKSEGYRVDGPNNSPGQRVGVTGYEGSSNKAEGNGGHAECEPVPEYAFQAGFLTWMGLIRV